jgi:anti-sigma factor ChrR (cupin superfamily)
MKGQPMTSANPVHPPKSQLIAFGQGKLAAEESTQVEQHLEVCPKCCETLLDLKDDTFTGLVRDARPLVVEPASATSEVVATETDAVPGSDAASRAVAGAATLAVQSGETLGADELPIELAEHPRYRIVE